MLPFGLVLAMGLVAQPAAAGVKEGVEKWQAGDYKSAVVEWLPHAAKGDPDALFNLGQAYKLGRGVPLDKAKAEDFYRRAADKGHAPAQSNLGIVLAQRGEKAAAAALWQKAAEKKDARAQYMLGVLHFNGDTVEKNWPLAYSYMVQANAAGLPQASRALATMNANMPQAERDRGTDLAGTVAAGSRLATSGTILPAARRIPNTVPAAAKAAPAAPAAVKPTPAPAASPVSFAAAVVPPKRTVVAKATIPEPAVDAGRWRVQLGAFSQETRAREAWAALARDEDALIRSSTPHYVTGGEVVRLQVGSFGEQADAATLCDQLKNAGRACFVVEAN